VIRLPLTEVVAKRFKGESSGVYQEAKKAL
jgi:hypothetical protein